MFTDTAQHDQYLNTVREAEVQAEKDMIREEVNAREGHAQERTTVQAMKQAAEKKRVMETILHSL